MGTYAPERQGTDAKMGLAKILQGYKTGHKQDCTGGGHLVLVHGQMHTWSGHYVDCRRHQAHEIACAPWVAYDQISIVITWQKSWPGSKEKFDLVTLGSKIHGVNYVVLYHCVKFLPGHSDVS